MNLTREFHSNKIGPMALLVDFGKARDSPFSPQASSWQLNPARRRVLAGISNALDLGKEMHINVPMYRGFRFTAVYR
jgi:hypothetical protein